ncbi:MAG: imidazolonepropionase, partial [Candidatus Thorarchaeota archaeon]
MKPDILLTNIGQVATLTNHSEKPKKGEELRELSIIENGAIAIADGVIIGVGSTSEILAQVTQMPELPPIEFPNMLATPGFIDSHTHLAFGGSRENDFAMKLQGKTYLEILEVGGGILNTLRSTRKASQGELCSNAFSYASDMVSMGTTTIEAKSGYGLDIENELKMLRAYSELRDKIPNDLISTFMGAHAIPPEFEGRTDNYVDLIINEMIPAVTDEKLAEFCDIFTEKGVFNVEQSRHILRAAKTNGMKLKVHADEIVQLGGAELAAEVGAVSADHLLMASDDGLEAMLKAGTIATLLPATAFSLNANYANARKMIDMGLPVALATDFNPNCANESLFFTIALACYKMKMQPREALSAVTINAAHALDRGKTHGSIEVGKRA